MDTAVQMGEGHGVNIVDISRHRGEFFTVLQQTPRSQTAVMTIPPDADAGPPEEHTGDQIVYVIEGRAAVTVGGATREVGAGALVMIPAHTRHYVKSTGSTPVFLLTVYSPPQY